MNKLISNEFKLRNDVIYLNHAGVLSLAFEDSKGGPGIC